MINGLRYALRVAREGYSSLLDKMLAHSMTLSAYLFTSEGEEKPVSNLDVVDHDEHGTPVEDRYLRLGAKGLKEEGLYVRFEPGFGLNVYIGHRVGSDFGYGGYPKSFKDNDGIGMSILGWEKLCRRVESTKWFLKSKELYSSVSTSGG